MSVFSVSPLVTTPSETPHPALTAPLAQTSTDDVVGDTAAGGGRDVRSRHRDAGYLALSPGTHIFRPENYLQHPSARPGAEGLVNRPSGSSLPARSPQARVAPDILRRAEELLVALPEQDSRRGIENESAEDSGESIAILRDGWQLAVAPNPPLRALLADFIVDLLPQGQKDSRFGVRLVVDAGLTPRLKELSHVTTARGSSFLMTPSVQGAMEEAGSFGKFRLALDQYGILVAVKEVRSAEAHLKKLAINHYDLRERGPMRLVLTDTSAFCFEMSVAKIFGRHFSHAALTRIDGKILSFHTLYAGGSLTRLFDGPLRFRDHLSLRVIADVAGDLARLHAAGLVHRDVRPPNILWDDSGFFLQDFGATRVLGPGQMLPYADATFAPPETYGPQRHVRAQTDAWALGMSAMSLLLYSGPGSPFPIAFMNGPYDAHEAGLDEYERWRHLYLKSPEQALSTPSPAMSPITRQCHAFFAERSLIAPQTVDLSLKYLLAARPEGRALDLAQVAREARHIVENQPQREIRMQQWLMSQLQRPADDDVEVWKRRLFSVRERWLEHAVHQAHHGSTDT